MTSPSPPDGSAPPLPPADRQLLDACLGGRPAGREAFVRRFAGLFATVATATASQRGSTLSDPDRETLVAEMLVACLEDDAALLRRFAGRSSLETYLAVVGRRIAVSRLLERRRIPTTEGPPDVDAVPATSSAPPPAPSPNAADDLDARLIRLHEVERRSYGEISRRTGLPLGAIGPALARARARLAGSHPASDASDAGAPPAP